MDYEGFCSPKEEGSPKLINLFCPVKLLGNYERALSRPRKV